MLAEAEKDPQVRKLVADPYALNPEGQRAGPDGRDLARPIYDPDFSAWIAPFVMAVVNTRVVRRSNALMNDAYGSDFRYDEAMLMGAGAGGWLRGAGLTAVLGGTMALAAVGPLRRALTRFVPKPGEGPSKAEREAGYFDLRFFGAHPVDEGKSLRARVTGDRDPGYGSTAKMLGESAVCLSQDELEVGGGVWTPASAMGAALLTRLQENAGLSFSTDPS
jgi:short subunit dehydrogenase-like uncharacterized protein